MADSSNIRGRNRGREKKSERSRLLTARRTLMASDGRYRKLPPLRIVAIGPEHLFGELARAWLERLAPGDIVHHHGDDPQGFMLLNQLPPARRRRAVIWHAFDATKPGPATIGAVRTMSKLRGTWLLAHCTTDEVPQGWSDGAVFDWTVQLRIGPSERVPWLQTVMGGAPAHVAQMLDARAGYDLARAMGEARLVREHTDTPTKGDVEAIVLADTGGDYAGALLACRTKAAVAVAPTVTRPSWAIAAVEHRLGILWSMLELRPPAARRLPREVAVAVGAPIWMVEELLPLIPKYSRQRVRARAMALRDADVQLRTNPTAGALVLTVLAAEW